MVKLLLSEFGIIIRFNQSSERRKLESVGKGGAQGMEEMMGTSLCEEMTWREKRRQSDYDYQYRALVKAREVLTRRPTTRVSKLKGCRSRISLV